LKTHLDGLEGSVSEDLLLFKRSVVLGGGSGMMIPRRVFEEIGKFDVRLSTSGDWDVFYQIAKRYQIGFVPEILLKYRVHGSNLHGNISRMEREMLLAYDKVFAEKDETLQKLRRTAYSNLHKVLAGSYFRCGNYWYFARNVVKSIRFKPRNISYFAKFPIRILQRKFKNSQYPTRPSSGVAKTRPCLLRNN